MAAILKEAPNMVLSANSQHLATVDNHLLRIGTGSSLAITSNGLLIDVDEFENHDESKFCNFWPLGKNRRIWNIPFYNILWVELFKESLIIQYAISSNENLIPSELRYLVDPKSQPVKEWIAELLDCSYRGSQRRKRAKVLLNPHSGQGKATRWYSKHIAPLLRAARCSFDVVETKQVGDGITIAEALDVDAFDMVVVCSGDGLAHEVFNGLGKRPDARKALLKIAVAHIPCGSGNGLSQNLNGTENVSRATLAVIKGVRKPLDLISVTQGDKRTLSFLSQATGMGAESDLATEHLRWMGATRFELGFLTRILAQKLYPAEIAIKIAIKSKSSIMDHYQKEISNHAREEAGTNDQCLAGEDNAKEEQNHEQLPPLKYGTINDKVRDDWVVVPCDNLGILYCGNLAYMSRDAKFFPPALHNDGLMDLVLIDGNISRRSSLKTFKGVKNDTFFDSPNVEYYKISAYRWTPKKQVSGFISVDGESVSFLPFQAEIHKGLGTVIMMNRKIAGAPPSV